MDSHYSGWIKMKVDHDVLAICLIKLGLDVEMSTIVRVPGDGNSDEYYEIKRVEEQ